MYKQFTMVSEYIPKTPFMGVRISCETVAKNCSHYKAHGC